jgi:crossover junction endodeoxyribonuclease RusA
MTTLDRYRVDLPWPVSANSLWTTTTINGRPRIMLTKAGRRYKDDVGWLARRAGIVKPFPGRVGLSVEMHPRIPADAPERMRKHGDAWEDTVRALDLDNILKATIDGLKGIAFGDDVMVWELHARRMPPRRAAGLTVEIWPIPYEVHQLDLNLFAATDGTGDYARPKKDEAKNHDDHPPDRRF